MTWEELARRMDAVGRVNAVAVGPDVWEIAEPRPRIAIEQRGVVVRGALVAVHHVSAYLTKVTIEREPGRTHMVVVDRVADNAFALLDAPGFVPAMAGCPRCGDPGEWRAMALMCRRGCGAIVGGPL